MENKSKIEILNKIMESLSKLDKLVVVDGFNELWAAKQLVATLLTILNIEEKMNEDTIDE